MSRLSGVIYRVADRMPTTLFIFLAGILVSNGVNLFNIVYGGEEKPSRSFVLLVSCGASIFAAALWTLLAAKIDQYEKTIQSVPYGRADRDSICADHWQDVWRRIAFYLLSAVTASIVALAVLLLPL
ncbi:MAG: hypothetical protein ACRDRK_23670 [Pseudonocardia sp.]